MCHEPFTRGGINPDAAEVNGLPHHPLTVEALGDERRIGFPERSLTALDEIPKWLVFVPVGRFGIRAKNVGDRLVGSRLRSGCCATILDMAGRASPRGNKARQKWNEQSV
jgi:hypothetical protein